MTKIVVSYRRADSAAIAGRIFDRLSAQYGDESVFMDVDNIPFGIDFRQHIAAVLATSDVFVAVVGPRWAGESGQRIKEAADPVRVEVETALQRGTPIIPLLVEGARMPAPEELPESLRPFAYLNAAPVDIGRDFRLHMERVIRSIDSVLAGTPNTLARPPDRRGRSRRLGWLGAAVVLLAAGVGTWAAISAGWLRLPTQQTPSSAVQTADASPPPVPPAQQNPQQPPPQPAPAPPSAPPPAPVATPNPVPSPPSATPVTYRVIDTVSGGVQNMRSGPATKYPLVVAVPAGSTGLAISGCRKSEDGTRPWCAVKWRSYAGWISSCCIVDEKTGAPPRLD